MLNALLALALSTLPAAAAAAPPLRFDAQADGGFPLQQAAHAIADELYETHRFVDELNPQVEFLKEGTLFVGLAASERVDAPQPSRSLLQRKALLVLSAGKWARVATLDAEVLVHGATISIERTLQVSAMDAALLADSGGLADLAGFTLRQTQSMEVTGDLLATASPFTDPAAAIQALRRLAPRPETFRVAGFVEDAAGRRTIIAGRDGSWGDAVRQLKIQTGTASMRNCVMECFAEVGMVISWTEALCLGIGMAACALGGPALFAACAQPIATGCGIVGVIGELAGLAACLIACI